ncbi:hypothetical protein GCM10023196_065910 [Actinoallomurus vinaceus]|uniref:Uncharacterized protein n=1 Tax=Actinoallomurus vinaceus TaxID=1080074 RepID=A0ABP8UIJ2_9ACTN
MSYDVAVWEGPRPSDDREAAEVHERLYADYLDADEIEPVLDVVRRFVEVLTRQWPDTNTGDDTPWAGVPLLKGASGPYVYLSISWSAAEEVSAFVADVADQFGLVCFDPQAGMLR